MAEVHETNLRVTKTPHSRLKQIDFDNVSFGAVFTDHMFQADSVGGEWTGLQLLPYGPVSFEPALMSLHYGQAIFEGMKAFRSEEHTSELQSLMRISYSVFCLTKKTYHIII